MIKTFKIIFLLSIVWFSLFVFIGVYALKDTPNQIAGNIDFLENSLKPVTTYVRDYLKANGKLPYYCDTFMRDHAAQVITDAGRLPHDLPTKITSIPEGGWVIAVWRGDWYEYYVSWDDIYIYNDYGWDDSSLTTLGLFLIGVIPVSICFIVVFIFKKIQLKRQRSPAAPLF